MSKITPDDESEEDLSKELSSLAPNNVLLMHRSETLAIVLVIVRQNTPPVIRRLEIPANLTQCPIARVFISYLNSEELSKNSGHDIYSKLLKYRKLLGWAKDQYKASELPCCVIQDFIRHLRQTTETQQNGLCAYSAAYRTAFDWFINKYEGDHSKRDIVSRLIDARSYIPSVSNRPAKSKPSISQISNCPETDELKILRSTIRFCCGFLKQMYDHRKILLSFPGVEKQLSCLVSECGGDCQKLKFNTKNIALHRLHLPIANGILQCDNLELKERLIYNQHDYAWRRLHDSGSLTITEANAKISAGLTASGGINIQPDNRIDTLYFHNLDYLYLIKLTPAEEICFAWLLATDRVQLSGVLDMLVGDLRINKNFASPIYRKGRSSQKIREVPMHPRSSMQYQAYCDYSELKNNFNANFPGYGEKLVSCLPNTDILQCLASPLYRPVILVSFAQTKLFKGLRNADGEIEIFASIINRVAVNNQALRRTNELVAKRQHINSTNALSPKSQNITVNVIAQSRAILDDYQADPTNEAYEKYSEEIINADSTAHSVDVKRYNYIHASETRYRLDKRAKFASAVGELMVEDARKVQSALSESAFVSVDELKIMLGWAEKECLTEVEEFDKLLKLAISEGYQISPFGQLTKNNKIIVVVNPVAAALLIDYRDECMSQLSIFSTEEPLRATAVIMQAAYIERVLDNFDRKTIADAHTVLKKYKFPTPIVR